MAKRRKQSNRTNTAQEQVRNGRTSGTAQRRPERQNVRQASGSTQRRPDDQKTRQTSVPRKKKKTFVQSLQSAIITYQSKERMPHVDALFLITILVLLTLGLIMLFSSSYAYAMHNFGDSFHFIGRQSVFAIAGVFAMAFISLIDYHRLKKFAVIIYGGSVVLMLMVFFFRPVNGARRWINLDVLSFQPSEIAKFAMILLFAYLIEKNRDRMKQFRYGVVPFALLLGVFVVELYFQPHLSGIILFTLIALAMLFIGGVRLRYFGMGIGAAAGAAVVLVLYGGVGYWMDRVNGWLNPLENTQGGNYQTIQSLFAIGSGGWTGLGLGNSRQKYLYLPEPQNDFIFSIVCEELGLIGAAIIIILFMILVVRGLFIAANAPDRFGTLLCSGLVLQIGLQAIVNIAVVTNTIPNTGISLPFFSYGGTALLMQLAQMGVVLNISRHSALQRQRAQSKLESQMELEEGQEQ